MPEINSFPILQPQTYKAMNRGDMFFPKGVESAPLFEAVMATPYMGSPMHVHAVPIFYGRPTAAARPQTPVGMPTPGVK